MVANPTTRPVWIQGPFASPFGTAMNFDKLLLVASGIGVTPALSCLRQYGGERRVALMWMCRDASLIKFFLEVCNFENTSLTLIFYTGKSPFSFPKRTMPSNVRILPGRPQTMRVIADIIYCVEKGVQLPNEYHKKSVQFTTKSVLRDWSAWCAHAVHSVTPTARLGALSTGLRQAGMDTADIFSLLDIPPRQLDIEVGELFSALHHMGATGFTEQDVAEIVASVNACDIGDNVVQRNKLEAFFDRMLDQGAEHRNGVRSCALRLLRVVKGREPQEPDEQRSLLRCVSFFEGQPRMGRIAELIDADSAQRLRAMASITACMIVVTDMEQRVVAMSEAATIRTGYSLTKVRCAKLPRVAARYY